MFLKFWLPLTISTIGVTVLFYFLLIWNINYYEKFEKEKETKEIELQKVTSKEYKHDNQTYIIITKNGKDFIFKKDK